MSVIDQPTLFDALRAPPIRRRVDPDGKVVQGKPRETLALPHPRLVLNYARIELHPSEDGLWMWSVSISTEDGYGSHYKVGEKWGHFALTRDDALYYAVQDIKGRLSQKHQHCKSEAKILTWANSLLGGNNA